MFTNAKRLLDVFWCFNARCLLLLQHHFLNIRQEHFRNRILVRTVCVFRQLGFISFIYNLVVFVLKCGTTFFGCVSVVTIMKSILSSPYFSVSCFVSALFELINPRFKQSYRTLMIHAILSKH